MSLMEMYAAVNDSPKAALAADITALTETIVISSSTALPDAPNLAVIGGNEGTEIIRYAVKEGTALGGVERGVNGTTPRNWAAGTPIARNYTSYDHDAFRHNIADLEARKTDSDNIYTKDETDALLDEKADLESPALTGIPTAPTAAEGTNTTQIATTAFVKTGLDGKSDTDHDHDDRYYTETEMDSKLNLKANLASPELTGTPTAPTPAASSNSTQIATTAFVKTGLAEKANTGHNHDDRYYTETETDALLEAKAPLASPSLSGTPTAPTAASGTSTTQIATTAFVAAGLSGKANTSHNHDDRYYTETEMDGKLAAKAEADHNHDSRYYTETEMDSKLNLKAPLSSPGLTGTPTAPTAAEGTNTTQIATTAFVAAGLSGKANSSHTHDDRYYTETETDALLETKAPLASPNFSGTPTAPTAAAGTNTNQVATTAFVKTGLDEKAPLASPNFSGTPQAPTAAAGTNTKQIATTAFVTTGLSGKANTSHNHDDRYYTEAEMDTALAAKAPLASPALSGTPTAPTAAAGTSTTQIATTAFVDTSRFYASATIGNNNAGYHNSIYRGKSLGASVTAAQYAAINAGTFDDLFIGDYWTIEGFNYRIAAFDYWYNVGDTTCKTHHALIVPDKSLVTSQMHSTATTEFGYVGTDFYTGANDNEAKSTVQDTLETAFGSSHLLTHRERLCNAVTTEPITVTIDDTPTTLFTNVYESSFTWVDSIFELMTEKMVWGTNMHKNKFKGSAAVQEILSSEIQLPLFRYRPDLVHIRTTYWLRDVAAATAFCYVYTLGTAAAASPANVVYGIRPAFGIKQ